MAKVKFARLDWAILKEASACAKANKQSKNFITVRTKLMDGLVATIDAEIKRREMTGERTDGLMSLSLDFSIEPFRLIEYDEDTPRNHKQELETALARPKKKMVVL